MADFIDRDALNWWDDLFMKGVNQSGVWVRYKDVEHFIKDAPAVDAVPVVRCRECRFNTTEKKCLNPDSIIKIPGDNDFCSYGEPREESDGNG